MIRTIILKTAIAIAGVGTLAAQSTTIPEAESFQARQVPGGDPDYQHGLSALDARNWDEAIDAFAKAAARKGSNSDAATYWLAYAQDRAGRRDEALATVRQLRQTYPSSRWINDAKALELEVHGQNGAPVSPSAESDQELKLLALNSLMNSDPNRAIPILRKVLTGDSSDKIRDKAMFVLVQNPSPEARKLLDEMAHGQGGTDLQLKAVRYVGMMGSDESRKELISIYNSSSDVAVKEAVLKSFMVAGARGQLLSVARSEHNPELRHEAIRQLAITGGKDELWQLFQQDSSVDDRKEILHSLFISGDATRLADAAQSLKQPELKAEAIKSLGLMGGNGRSDVLVSIYRSDPDKEVRRAVLNSLFLQQNGKALVELARSEKDPEMKAEIVKKMSLVHSPEVTDYMMEILK